MNPYSLLVFGVILGLYLVNTAVNILNARAAQQAAPPALAGLYPPAEYARSQAYLREATRFEVLSDTLTTAALVGFILAGGFDAFDRLARQLASGPIARGLIFFGLLLLAYQLLLVPLSAYATFRIEGRYGFNRTTPGTFLADLVKGWLLAALVGGVLLALVIWLFGRYGREAWLVCWGTVTLLQLGLAYLAPAVIMPLFNRFEPLAEGPLRARLAAYLQSRGVRFQGIFTMDGSRRSSKGNAFLTGFGRFRRIVLLDTLIDRHGLEEVVAVVGHELGHYRRRHLAKSLALAIGTQGAMLLVVSRFINNPGLFAAFGMQSVSIYGSLLLCGFLFAPLEWCINVGTHILQRRWEYAADADAVAGGIEPGQLIAALKRLSAGHLANLNPHPWHVFLNYSHPPLLARIKAIRAAAAGDKDAVY